MNFLTIQNDQWILVGSITILALLLIGLVRKLNRPIKTIDSLIEDKEAYHSATSNVNKDQLVPIARISSAQGYSESDLMELVMALGSQGINATYRSNATTHTMVGALTTYTISVQVQDVEKAKPILEQLLSQ